MNTIRLYKALSITLAAIALVTTTACTRDKGGKEATPGTPAKTETPPQAQTSPPTIPGSGDQADVDAEQDVETDGEQAEGSAQVRTGSVHYDPTGLTPEQIRAASEAQGPVLVGPKSDLVDFSGAELFYSGSGQDTLREVITAHVESRTEEQKTLDGDLVRRMRGATVDVDWSARKVQVSVTLERGGGVATYKTTGNLSNQLSMSTVSPQNLGDLAFEAKCMDREGGCKTIYLMVQEQSVNGTRTAHLLLRKTQVAWFLEAQATDRFHNAEFSEMLETMWLRDEKSVRRVEKVEMDTVEVVGGISILNVRMLARKSYSEAEWLAFTGPLVKPQSSSDTNLMLNVASRGPLSSSIRDVRMTYNDGRGNVRAVVTVRKLRENEKEASLVLTFARVHAPAKEFRLK